MCNCTICYIAREQHIDALPCEIQNGNGSVGGIGYLPPASNPLIRDDWGIVLMFLYFAG